MIVKRSDLKAMLDVLSKALTGSNGLSLLTDKIAIANGYGIATSAESTIYYHIPEQGLIPVSLGGNVIIKGKEFAEAIAKLPADTADLSLENKRLILKCGKSVIKFNCIDLDISALVSPTLDWKEFGEDFSKALLTVDLGRNSAPFCGTFIDGENGRFVSTDGFQISFAAATIPIEERFLLSTESMSMLAGIGAAIKRMAYDGKQLWFASLDNNLMISVRTLDVGLFPVAGMTDAVQHAKGNAETIEIEMPGSFEKVIERASIFKDVDKSIVDFKFENGAIIVLSRSEGGEYAEKIECPTLSLASSINFGVPSGAALKGIKLSSSFSVNNVGSYSTMFFKRDNGKSGYMVSTIEARQYEIPSFDDAPPVEIKEETKVESKIDAPKDGMSRESLTKLSDDFYSTGDVEIEEN